MSTAPRIFLSHSSADNDRVQPIAEQLLNNGISVWIDEAEIKWGDSINKKIDEGLRNADYVLVFLSKNSVKSRWVDKEINMAFARNPKDAQAVIIPVLLDKLDVSEIPSHLRNIAWLDLSESYESGIVELIHLISRAQKDKKPDVTPKKVLDVGGLAKEVAQELMHVFKTNSQGIRIPDYTPNPKLVFVIIAFSPDMEPIFEGIKTAGKKRGLEVERVKDIAGDFRITDKVIEMIHKARFIVTDLTHEKPNVYFELGYARGMGEEVITIAREGTKLHFDVKDWTCFFYYDSRNVEAFLDERFEYELTH
jgi:hypothetical protein